MYAGYTDDDAGDAGALAAALQTHNASVAGANQAARFDCETHSNQKTLSDQVDDAARAALWGRSSAATRAHLALVAAPGASAHLQAPPSEALGTAVPHSLMQIGIKRRLRVQLMDEEAFCPACGEVMDVHCDHALTCACQGDRTRRHNKLRNGTFFAAQAAGFSGAELERPGLLPPRAPGEGPNAEEPDGDGLDNDGRRPADVYVPRWRGGLSAALDFGVTSGRRADLIARSAADPAAALDRYEEHKRQHQGTAQACRDADLSFIPMVVEAHGGSWGGEARRAFAVLAKRAADACGEEAASTADRMAQRLSISLHRENARAILQRLRRLRRPRPGATPARLAAAAAAAAVEAAAAAAVA